MPASTAYACTCAAGRPGSRPGPGPRRSTTSPPYARGALAGRCRAVNTPPGSPSTSVAHSHIPSGGGPDPASAATSTSSAGSARPVPSRPPGTVWPGRASSVAAVMISLLLWGGHGGGMPPGFPGPRTRTDGAGYGGPRRAQPVRSGGREPLPMDAHLFPARQVRPRAPGCPAITQSRDLTPGAEAGVDAAGPGWQASRTCPLVRYPATAEVGGRPAPQSAARDSRRPAHPRRRRTARPRAVPGTQA